MSSPNTGIGTVTEMFDVIVIGVGPVGENVADRVVRGGLSAAIVLQRFWRDLHVGSRHVQFNRYLALENHAGLLATGPHRQEA